MICSFCKCYRIKLDKWRRIINLSNSTCALFVFYLKIFQNWIYISQSHATCNFILSSITSNIKRWHKYENKFLINEINFIFLWFNLLIAWIIKYIYKWLTQFNANFILNILKFIFDMWLENGNVNQTINDMNSLVIFYIYTQHINDMNSLAIITCTQLIHKQIWY